MPIILIPCQAPFVGESILLASRINANFEIRSSNIRSQLLSSSTPRYSATFLTIPWSSGFVFIILYNGHWLLGASSLSNAVSLILKFRFLVVHFCLSWRVWTNSLHRLHQNSLVICCNLLHLYLKYKSGLWKTLGGGITTFDLLVNKLFGDKGLKPCPSLFVSTVSGRELITASVSATSVCRDSSS